LTVDGTGTDLFSVPDLLGMLRRTFGEGQGAEWLSVFHKSYFCNLMSHIIDVSAFCLHVELFCKTHQFLRIFYLVVAVCCSQVKCMGDLTSMVRMGSCSAGGETEEVSSY